MEGLVEKPAKLIVIHLLVEGLAHAQHPLLARLLADREGKMPSPQPGVPVFFDIEFGGRLATPLLELGEDPSWVGDLRLDGSIPHKSVRFAGADASRASLWLNAVNEAKCRVSVSHTKIQTSEEQSERKKWWAERLQTVADRAAERHPG